MIAFILTLYTSLAASSTPGVASGENRDAVREECYFDGAYKVRRLEGHPAPEWNVAKWLTTPHTLKDLKGRIIVLDLWAAWCPPCIGAMNVDAGIARDYSERGVTIVAIHDPAQGWERAVKECEERQVHYSVALDATAEQHGTVATYGAEFWPTYVVIDRGGIVRAAGLKPACVRELVEILLQEPEQPRLTQDAFPVEVYVGGATRPKELRQVEGKRMQSLNGDEWLGVDQSRSVRSNKATVLHFWSPTIARSVRDLDLLRSLESEFAVRGVRLVAVCDGRADWEAVKKKAASGQWTTTVMRDRVAATADQTVVSTSESLGVLIHPATLVVDEAGTVRAAGIRADKALQVIDELLAGRNGVQAQPSIPRPK